MEPNMSIQTEFSFRIKKKELCNKMRYFDTLYN